MPFLIQITPAALESLRSITDKRSRASIVRRIDGLTERPNEQGKPLLGELRGLLSLRAAGQRYRVVFRVNEPEMLVVVMLVGIRKEGSRRDVYALAQRLVERGFI